MSTVFMSFLGTSAYKECEYTSGDTGVKTRFIQEALIKLFCANFTEADSICIFLTQNARETNWNALHERINALKLPAKLRIIDIPDGKSEAEIWDIFTKMFDAMGEKDAVIFDITHGFRSLPMLGFSILNYARYLKNIQVAGIYYGAYEAKDADERTPIFALKAFYDLMQWSSAANSFVNYGIADELIETVHGSAALYLGSDGTAKAIGKISETLSTLRGADIVEGKIFVNCINKIENLESQGNYQAAFQPLFQQVRKKLDGFKPNDPMNFFYAVQWYMRHNMIPHALTMMQEGLLTCVMARKNMDWRKREHREHISGYLVYIYRQQSATTAVSEEEFFKSDAQRALNIELALQSDDAVFGVAAVLYGDIQQTRNDVNHGGFNQNGTSYNRIINRTRELSVMLEQVCAALSGDSGATGLVENTSPC
jgi:CRISPR-associated Csx2 family protein